MPATERLFSHTPSSNLYLDTDLILNYLSAHQPHHARTVAFVVHLFVHSSTTIYISSLTWIEFVRVVTRERYRNGLPTEERRRFRLDQWLRAAVRAEYIDYHVELLERFLAQFPRVEVELTADVRSGALDYMKQYDLDAHDALHLASAVSANVLDFASFDRAFRWVDGLYLWNDRIHGSGLA